LLSCSLALSLSHLQDWEIWHNKGLCFTYLKDYEEAIDCFERANDVQRHDASYLQLGKIYCLQEDFKAALKTYQEAVDFSPQNSEILTTLGLVYLRLGENQKGKELCDGEAGEGMGDADVRALTNTAHFALHCSLRSFRK
jgi:tetratricopeptide (TPR) repeat protein